MNGKGSKRRPTNEEAYQSNWEKIFGDKKKHSHKDSIYFTRLEAEEEEKPTDD